MSLMDAMISLKNDLLPCRTGHAGQRENSRHTPFRMKLAPHSRTTC